MYLVTIGLVWLAILQQPSLCQRSYGTGHESPKAELPRTMQRRAVKGRLPPGLLMSNRPFGRNPDSWLNSMDSVLATDETPIYLAESDPHGPAGVRITPMQGLMKVTAGWLNNPKHLATITLKKDRRSKTRMNVQNGSKKSTIRPSPKMRKPLTIFSSIARNETMPRNRMTRSTHDVPYVIYPKVLVVAEYSMYEKLDKDIYRLVKYLLTMMNGVDLKYRVLQYPRVRINVAGIVVATDPGATPYVANYMLNNETFDTFQAMPKAKNFFYDIKNSIPLESYHLALTVTRHYFGVDNRKGILGQSWNHTICGDNKASKLMEALAIVRDNGALSSIHWAAHELGHVLGLNHDAIEPAECSYRKGFIMTFAPVFTTKSSSFSDCSLRDFQQRLRDHKLDCLFEMPRINPWVKLPNLIPGMVMDWAEQCQAMGLGSPCTFPDLDICVHLGCYNDAEEECEAIRYPALEGTQCNDRHDDSKRYCIQHQCVSL